VRILELPEGATPREWGRIHGETFRGEVRALCAIRTWLCSAAGGKGGFADRAAVLAAAEAHLPILARYDQALHDEVLGIAEGAGVTAAEIVVANHYTDLRDLDPDPSKWQDAPGLAELPSFPDADGGCSVVWSESRTGRLLAQTWDMHATAIPYVMALYVPESEAGPEAWLLTVTGCLGMAGLNGARTAIAINNLNSRDATVGVVWPAMVRKALKQTSAAAARDVIMGSPVGSGHHYFVADRREAFGVETSGRLRKVIFGTGGDSAEAATSYWHTNHCLDPDVAACSTVPPTSTTHDRYAWLQKSLSASEIRDLPDVWERLGSQEGWPRSVCTNMATPESPHGSATCGAIAMNLDTGEVWMQGGFTTHVRAERFRMMPLPLPVTDEAPRSLEDLLP
jgi:isopenicillin-N N-acyltransferase-like protein